jgi:hypothetical protein
VQHLEGWRFIAVVGLLILTAIVAVFVVYVVVKEIWYAVHPDKRPLKKRPKRDE